jgi:hypothetical protein
MHPDSGHVAIGSVAAVNQRFQWGKWRNDVWEACLSAYPGIVGRGRIRDEAVDDALRQAREREAQAGDRITI